MKKLFYLLVLLLPINLGKHFIFKDAYVKGLLVDYLIPTVYLLNILVAALLVVWIIDAIKKRKKPTLNQPATYLPVIYLFAAFLSTLISPRFVPSFAGFIQLALHIGLYFFVIAKINVYIDRKIFKLGLVSMVFVVGLAILQLLKQGAVFNNYIFFGEQPYTFISRGIVKEIFLDFVFVPPYGTFRHPNILAAYLCIGLTVFIGLFLKNRVTLSGRKRSYALVFIAVSSILLFFTFGKIAWLAFLFGLLCFLITGLFGKKGLIVTVGLFGLAFGLINLLPFLINDGDPSLYLRADLLKGAFTLISHRPLFGVGFNSMEIYIWKFLMHSDFLLFIQPVHNIFVLVFTESGIFAFLAYMTFLIYTGYTTVKKALAEPANYTALLHLVLFMQLMLMASFDHYFMTITQTSIIYWLTVGILIKYNLSK